MNSAQALQDAIAEHPSLIAHPAPPTQTPGHPSFRRQRASRACETCHTRKVRCDAASLGVPCTNCTAFNIECNIPTTRRKKTRPRQRNEDEDSTGGSGGGGGGGVAETSPTTVGESPLNGLSIEEKTTVLNSPNGAPSLSDMDAFAAQQASHNATYAQFMKPKFARAPIKDAGRVAYLGESSNLSLLVHDQHGTTDVVHYPLPENIRGAKARVNELDNVEIDILHQRGAFLLPPRSLCDELVDAYFTWIAPVVPVINRSRFMRQYRDPANPPSLLLLQAVLLAGSRVCTNPQLMDSSGSTTPAAMTFYKRAKALFDANYEDDRVTIVQALVLMGWYWEGPEDVTKNVFYWTRTAVVVAQGSGMHRSVENSLLSKSDKRLWKRIWWTLFARDRSVAVAMGRPVGINAEDSDVEMVSEDDFTDDEDDVAAEYTADPIHVQFFLNYVKLCEVMGLVLSQEYSVASKSRRSNPMDLTHSDVALADWLRNCPKEVYWDRQRHHFWAALLHANYYTTLCLLHRAHMSPANAAGGGQAGGARQEEAAYSSRNIAYHAAGMITSIVQNLAAHQELRYTPAFIVYSLFSALIMHVYQMKSSNKAVVSMTEQRLQTCMNGLKEVSKVWLVAKMVHTLFQSIMSNKTFEERLHKAASKRHPARREVAAAAAVEAKSEGPKRKFSEVDFAYSKPVPAAPVSYERSRPQTPAIGSMLLDLSQTASGTAAAAAAAAALSPAAARSPPLKHEADAFMGGSRTTTRQTSPFTGMPSIAYPATPPDLFLVTRNSPTISEALWQNFQPDQLFPAEANVSFPPPSLSVGTTLPTPQSALIDPQLGRGPQTNDQQQQMLSQPLPLESALPTTQSQLQGTGTPFAPPWSPYDTIGQHGMPDDAWADGGASQGGPSMPTTLNVEDWFNFFGLNGDGNNYSTSFAV